MNVADLIVIAVLLLSGLIALMRGFIREVLSLAGWVGAAFVTLWGFAHARPYARDLISHPVLADVAAGVVLFVISLVLFSVASNAVGNLVRSSGLNALDRSLGFVFGLARGLVVVGLIYLAMVLWVFPAPADRPIWIREARTLPLVEATADLLQNLAPPEFRGRAHMAEDEVNWKIRQARDAQRALEALSLPTTNTPASKSETGYKSDVRRDLERLIQNAEPQGQKNR
ncbi:MAG TPA: CvpA family protein [Alphaproteobacteria bacterium]